MSKFLLIDGTALVFRGFYAIPPLKTTDGTQINAVFGFYTILLNLLIAEKPDYLAVCFDRQEVTRRKEEYEDYKANREKAPDELYSQIAPIKTILTEGGFNLVEKPGVEADDLIATLARKNETPNIDVIVYSNDFDLLQLVNDIKVLKPGHGRNPNILMGVDEVIKKYGFTPDFIPDYKGLHGDSSDNLPGIKGVGEKTASKLIQDYGHLEDIYENLDNIKGALKTKLIEGKDMAYMCRDLATLHDDIDIPTEISNYGIENITFSKTKEFFIQLEMKKLIQKLENLESKLETVKHQNQQQALF